MSALWLIAYDANWNKLTDAEGPVLLQSARVSRPMDGVGTINFTTPGQYEPAIKLLTPYRRFKIYYDQDGVVREFASGIVQGVNRSSSESGLTREYSAVDRLHEMVVRSTLFNRVYPAATTTVESILSSLAGLAGWTVDIDSTIASDPFEARFDGTNVFKALMSVIETRGLHFRQTVGVPVLEVGVFGEAIGLRCVAPDAITPGMLDNDDLAFITSIGIEQESRDVFNEIIPTAAGEGEARITLEGLETTFTDIVVTGGPDGRNVYSLVDAASVSAYGLIQRAVAIKNISPVFNTDSSRVQAAVQLYYAAKTELTRSAQPQSVYRLELAKVRRSIRPGDRVRLVWMGEVVNDDGHVIAEEDINGDFYMVRVDEAVDDAGNLSTSLAVSNVDKAPETAEDVVINALDEIEVRNFQRLTFPALYPSSERAYIEAPGTNNPSGTAAVFTYRINTLIAGVTSIWMNIRTEPLTTFSRYRLPVASYPGPFPIPLYSPNDGLQFTCYKDDDYPRGIYCSINGVDQTSALGGPFQPTLNAALTLNDLDITAFLQAAPGGLRQTHTITFTCTTASGNAGYPGAGTITDETSHGVIIAQFVALGSVQANIPT
jgi:hypothetical protein